MTVTTPIIDFHMEAETDDCICRQLAGCGGIVEFCATCPEHGIDSGPTVMFHTHAKQVDKVTRGRWVP